MADNSKEIRFDWQEDGEWLRMLINGQRSSFGVCVIHPFEANFTFSSQDDLKNAMVEVVLQMIEQGSFSVF